MAFSVCSASSVSKLGESGYKLMSLGRRVIKTAIVWKTPRNDLSSQYFFDVQEKVISFTTNLQADRPKLLTENTEYMKGVAVQHF